MNASAVLRSLRAWPMPAQASFAGPYQHLVIEAAEGARARLTGAERRAITVAQALDALIVERAVHVGSCSFCWAHRRAVCPRRRAIERAIRAHRRQFGRAMTLLGDC